MRGHELGNPTHGAGVPQLLGLPQLLQALGIVGQKTKEVAHWNAGRLGAGLVLLKGSGPASEDLPSLALAETEHLDI